MAILVYNNIALQVTNTKQHDIKPAYSEDGSDVLWNVHTLVVEGIFNPRATSYSPVTGGADPRPASPHHLCRDPRTADDAAVPPVVRNVERRPGELPWPADPREPRPPDWASR